MLLVAIAIKLEVKGAEKKSFSSTVDWLTFEISKLKEVENF